MYFESDLNSLLEEKAAQSGNSPDSIASEILFITIQFVIVIAFPIS